MDFDSEYLRPYQLEIGCLVGHCIGTKNKFFLDLFKRQPWLMGDDIPFFTHVKNIKRLKVPSIATKFYSAEAYVAMVIKFGQILIRNHEIDLFKEFFFSQNCLYMDDEIVTSLLEECFNYLVPECTVPIFAFCSARYTFRQSTDSQKLVHEYFSCESSARVTDS